MAEINGPAGMPLAQMIMQAIMDQQQGGSFAAQPTNVGAMMMQPPGAQSYQQMAAQRAAASGEVGRLADQVPNFNYASDQTMGNIIGYDDVFRMLTDRMAMQRGGR